MNHNLPIEIYEYHEWRAQYWSEEEKEATAPERRQFCHEMLNESLHILGMIALNNTELGNG